MQFEQGVVVRVGTGGVSIRCGEDENSSVAHDELPSFLACEVLQAAPRRAGLGAGPAHPITRPLSSTSGRPPRPAATLLLSRRERRRAFASCDAGRMACEGGAAQGAGQEWVVLASFENRHAAEHMLLSLGRGFRKKAGKCGASALVVTGNKDGSLKLTESRVLEAGDFMHTLLHLSVSWVVGFLGTLSTLKGVKAGAHADRKRESHVGSDEPRAHEIIAEAGPNAAIALVRRKD